MRPLICGTLALAISVGSVGLSADRIRLRSGRTVDGSFLSADVRNVRLLLPNGTVAEFPVADVTALEFSPRKSPPPPSPDPSRAPSPVTVPAGTVLNVRLVEAIEVDAARTGATFKSLLDDPVMISGAVLIPRGTIVALQATKVEQAGTMKGADKITLKANSMAYGGQNVRDRNDGRRVEGRRRRQEDGAQGGWRRRTRSGDRRHRRRRNGGGDWRRRGYGDRRGYRQSRNGTSLAAGRNAASVHAERGGDRASVMRTGPHLVRLAFQNPVSPLPTLSPTAWPRLISLGGCDVD